MCRSNSGIDAAIHTISHVFSDDASEAVLLDDANNAFNLFNCEFPTSASANFQDGARLDLAADGFWGSRFERAFFDLKVFNPYAPSNRRPQLTACDCSHEVSKKRAYEQRILKVEHDSFSPLSSLLPKA
ncbi:hypothetical protein EMCRGX_G002398 [Ephydatia muelleri]